MSILKNLAPDRVFYHFEKLCSIPRGSGNMEKISNHCVNFAKEHSLDYYTDAYHNVIIYKNGTKGYETSMPIILQGHLDMVCQKENDLSFDFEKDALEIFVDGDFIKAKGTTLGADNGIAVAMIFAILESHEISHPPIEAVFTTDEEIGMIGASKLDMSLLSSKRMINLDSECIDILTVSCAGGVRVEFNVPLNKKICQGTKIELSLSNLCGGHSGVEIHKGRENANTLMGRILNHMKNVVDFDVISINGGRSDNVITPSCTAELVTKDSKTLKTLFFSYLLDVKKEISSRERDFSFELNINESSEFQALTDECAAAIIKLLACSPQGVVQMSTEIEGLVETSLNLGVVSTKNDNFQVCYALRSSKATALDALKEKMYSYGSLFGATVTSDGKYPPWEYVSNSELQALYKETYFEKFGEYPSIEAIHAGLECGMFSGSICGLDCISFGPVAHDIHSANEKLSISSTSDTFELLLNILKKCK